MSQRRAAKGSRAIVYVRVSHREQETLADQERRCRAYCEAQGWEVTRVLKDRASAWSGKDRPGWLTIEGMVAGGEVDAVVVFQISRAARNVGRLALFIELCRDNGVVFAAASEGVNTATAMGRMMAQLIGALAELESEIKSERVILKFEEKRAKGEWTGGRVPFGFRAVGGKLVKDEAEAKLVREAASRLLAGEGLRTVARDWTSRGVPTQRNGRWSPTTLHDILLNPIHEGATLTHRDFERVRAVLEERSRTASPRGDRYLLTGKLRCGVCGASLVGQPREGVRRYICNKGPHDTVIRADVVEDLVTRRATEAELDVEGIADPAEVSVELLERLGRAEDRLRAFAREAASAGMGAAEIRAGREPLAAERDRLQREVDESASGKRFSYADLLEVHEEPTPIQWRAEVEEVVDHVVIAPRIGAESVEARIGIRWREGVRLPEPPRGRSRRRKKAS